MGKRVNRNRRVPHKDKTVVAAQSPKAIPQEKTACVENSDEGVTAVKERKPCPHFDKGLDLDKLLAKLKSSDLIRCEDCRESGNDRRGSKGKGKHGKKKGSASVDSKSESKAIWVCLGCGHYVCAGVGLPTASTTHAIRHLRQTRHNLVIQCDNPQLRWCFACSTFIPVEKMEENGENKDVLYNAVKLIKERSSEPSATDVEDVWFGSGSVTSATKSEGTIANTSDEKTGYAVRGLVNLGNTCFFNSVMQNLLALDRLRDYFLNQDASMGQLTISLKKLFAETKPEMGLKSTISPKSFFGSICAKAPQFKGYQQHDSHEFLRCLLDGLYTEELAHKKHINASKNDVMVHKDLTFVDAVFGGQISSTLCCVECGHSSTVYEPFLDISLPVPTKKTSSKKVQPVPRSKKTKLPPKKLGKARGKITKNADQIPALGITTPLSSNESSGLEQTALSKAETMVASCGDSSLSSAIGPSTETNEVSSALQNPSDGAESKNDQVMGNTVKGNAAGEDDFAWMDYLVMENTLQEDTAEPNDFTWMDYLQERIVADENDLISQNNVISLFQDSEGKNLVPSEALAESPQIALLEGETKQDSHHSSGKLEEEELPLLVQDSAILLVPYKEENTGTEESVRENEASSTNAGHEQEEMEFDGFGDMFNEPEISSGPSIGPSLANDIAETGFMAGNISEADPDEVDDSDSPVSVESCLAHFIKPELLCDDNAWNCGNCAKILQRQKLKAKKKQTKILKNLTNGGESQSHCEPPSLDKELTCPNGVRTISNGDINSSHESLVEHNEINGSLGQNRINVENGQTSQLNSVLSECEEGTSQIEDARVVKSNSSGSSKSSGQEQSGGIQSFDSCNVKNHSGNNKFQQSNSQVAENCQSGESDDEEIDSVNLKVKRNATKRVLINKAPPILTIHLKRFSQDARGRLSKLNGHVSFKETMDLRPYVDPRCEDRDNCIYRLMGVVEHSGTMRGGHYIAYVRGGEKRKDKLETEPVSSPWYYASDQYVRQVSLEEVLRCEAYILFYEKN